MWCLSLFLIFVTCSSGELQHKNLLQPLLTKGGRLDDGPSNSSDTCFIETPTCDPTYRYRSFDGSCHNLEHPTWGMATTAFTRIFSPRYRDEEKLPPIATNGSELPNTRILSVSFFPDGDSTDDVSLTVMSFGQFFAHDIAVSLTQDSVSDCCSSDDPYACYPITVADTDPFYSQFEQKCLNFVRSQITLTGNCESGPGQQINGVTHFIDASHVYGLDKETADSIREKVGGRLLVSTSSRGKHFLPHQDEDENDCVNSDVCYRGGDSRINQNTHLTTIHIVFHREHNRIANKLASLHPTWDDETLYQESRIILIAELQHIVSRYYLPSILGEEYVNEHVLKSSGYNNTVLPLIINSVTAGVFRILHSGIQGILNLYNYQLDPVKNINISDYMNSPGFIEDEDNLDELLLGLLVQPSQKIDEIYTSQMDEFMFHGLRQFGSDLSATDLQRGRDHAIASYATVLSACEGIEINDFTDLADYFEEENLSKLQEFYPSVDDIDLFVGGNLEITAPGEKLGPVSKCLLAEQFYRLIAGDRFWYEVQGQPHSFTLGQLNEIRKASLSRIICDNSDGIVNIPLNAFVLPNEDSNPVVACEDLPSIDLEAF